MSVVAAEERELKIQQLSACYNIYWYLQNMAEEFDYSLFGDSLVKPSTGESADPMEVLTDKVVRFKMH